ncbi:MAG: SLOG family protein [Clostridia bacterium]|nr:SLOG family protein [Clostridia bacterium]
MKSCCFTGHRSLPAGRELTLLSEKTKAAIENAYADGFTRFIAGGAVGFDLLCERLILEAKKQHPDISLAVYIPCKEQAYKFAPADKLLYERLNAAADELLILSNTYYSGCMHVRNRRMVDDSSLCIAYLTKPQGGTASTVAYAKSKGVSVIIL